MSEKRYILYALGERTTIAVKKPRWAPGRGRNAAFKKQNI